MLEPWLLTLDKGTPQGKETSRWPNPSFVLCITARFHDGFRPDDHKREHVDRRNVFFDPTLQFEYLSSMEDLGTGFEGRILCNVPTSGPW